MRTLVVCCTAACTLLATSCTCSDRDTPRSRPAPTRADQSTKTPPPATPDAAPRTAEVPALFSPLFVKGRAWIYDYNYEYPDHVPFGGPTTMLLDGTLRCRVEEVQTLGQVRLSRVGCRLFEEGEDLAGNGEEAVHQLGENVFIAGERGLWIGDPDACKALSAACAKVKGPPYLPAVPKARREEKKKGKAVTTIEVRRQAVRVGEASPKAWCRRLVNTDKHERYVSERCFAPERGLVREANSLKTLNVARPDEEAAMGDPSWWKGSIIQTGELKPKPKPKPAP